MIIPKVITRIISVFRRISVILDTVEEILDKLDNVGNDKDDD